MEESFIRRAGSPKPANGSLVSNAGVGEHGRNPPSQAVKIVGDVRGVGGLKAVGGVRGVGARNKARKYAAGSARSAMIGKPMQDALIEDILSCPSLPSLPAVALRVIEMTSDRNISLKELAATIQNDQGLAAKVLRTVNSSYYGLRTRCATIDKALVMLGLGPVKALTLGFSLVSSQQLDPDCGFDVVSYWRRGLYSAVAAKALAEAAGESFADEAFLAGLLQDIGVMAMYRALGDDYLEVMRRTDGDHNKLVRVELEAFDMQHPEVGAMLAERWRLPNELVMPVRFHERPTAAPKDCAPLVRCVALANMVHDTLTLPEPTETLSRLYSKAEQWLRLKAGAVDEVLRSVSVAGKEMSGLFKLNTGSATDADTLLTRAAAQLASITPAVAPANTTESGLASLLRNDENIDALTGAMSRKAFEASIKWAFEVSKTQGGPVSLVQLSVDTFEHAKAFGGDQLTDQILVGVSTLLQKHFQPLGGVVCRLNGGLFSVILQGATPQAITSVAEELRADIERVWPQWKSAHGTAMSRFGVTIALACRDNPAAGNGVGTPSELIVAAAKAIQESRTGGASGVRTVKAA